MARADLPWRQPLLFQYLETETPFSFSEVVEEARAVWFPQLDDLEIEVRLASLGPLASLWYHRMGWERHIIVFHPVLNHASVPVEVVRFIAKHELTHLVVRSRGHSPEFWEHEAAVGPERYACWRWIYQAFGRALSENRYGLTVRRRWREGLPAQLPPYMPNLPFEHVPFATLCPDGGAQLRFQPTWSRGPAPLSARYGVASAEATESASCSGALRRSTPTRGMGGMRNGPAFTRSIPSKPASV